MTAFLALMLALQQTPAPAAAAPAPPAVAAPAAQTPPRRPPQTSPSLQLRVTDRSGTPQEGAMVTAEGPVSREGVTDRDGMVQFKSLGAGTYRIRAAHESLIALEKEVAVRAGATAPPIEFALSAAPPPPPPVVVNLPAPTPAPPPPATPLALAGEARILSVADLAERSLAGREPVRTVPVGCSGLDATQMLVLRETLNSPANVDVDQMLYVVAGEAMLTLAGRDQTITSGWFVLVPRGAAFTLVRRGRNPAIVLETIGGQPCAAPSQSR